LHIYSDDAAIELSHAEGITLEPPLGVLTIDSLTSGATTDSLLTWNKNTGRVGRIPNTSSSLTPLDVQATDVSNTSTTETVLHTYSIAGNTLSTDKDVIDFDYTYHFASNTNSKTIAIYFGTSVATMPTNSSGAGGDVHIVGHIIRTSSTTASIYGTMDCQNGTTGIPFYTTASSLDYTSAIVLKSTGTGGATNDITQHTSTVRKVNHP
jgi:hypothetical protein